MKMPAMSWPLYLPLPPLLAAGALARAGVAALAAGVDAPEAAEADADVSGASAELPPQPASKPRTSAKAAKRLNG